MMHRSRSALPALGLSFWGGQKLGAWRSWYCSAAEVLRTTNAAEPPGSAEGWGARASELRSPWAGVGPPTTVRGVGSPGRARRRRPLPVSRRSCRGRQRGGACGSRLSFECKAIRGE